MNDEGLADAKAADPFRLPRPHPGIGSAAGGRRKGLEDVEFATLEWVAWYNGSRLLEPLGYISPAEFERAYYDRQTASNGVAVLT